MADGGDRHAGWNALLIGGDPHSALANYHYCEFSHQSHRGAGNFHFYSRSAEFFNVVDQHDFKNSIILETKCTPASQMMAEDSHFWCVA